MPPAPFRPSSLPVAACVVRSLSQSLAALPQQQQHPLLRRRRVYTSRHTPPTPSHLLLAIVAQGNSKSPPPRRARPARAAADAQPRTVWVPLSATDDHQWSDHDESSPPDVASIGGNGGNGSGATPTSGSQYGGHHGGHHSGHHGDSKSNKPKRKQVKQACYQCRKAHAACGDERPCVRCQAKGIADQCSNSAPSSSDLSRTEPSHSPGFGDLLDPSSSLGHAAGTAASAAAVAAAVATPTPGVGLPIGSAASSTSSLGGGGSTQHRSKRRRTEQDEWGMVFPSTALLLASTENFSDGARTPGSDNLLYEAGPLGPPFSSRPASPAPEQPLGAGATDIFDGMYQQLLNGADDWNKPSSVRNMSEGDIAMLLKEFAQLRSSNAALESMVQHTLHELQNLRSQSDRHIDQHMQQLQYKMRKGKIGTSPSGPSLLPGPTTMPRAPSPLATTTTTTSSSYPQLPATLPIDDCTAQDCPRTLPTCLGYREKMRPPRHSLQFQHMLQHDSSATADGVGCNTWYTFMPQPPPGEPITPKIPASCWDLETGRLLECNKEFVNLVGYPLAVLQNNFNCLDLVPKAAHAETSQMLSRLRRDVQYAEAKAIWITASGEQLCVSSTFQVFRNAHSHLTGPLLSKPPSSSSSSSSPPSSSSSSTSQANARDLGCTGTAACPAKDSCKVATRPSAKKRPPSVLDSCDDIEDINPTVRQLVELRHPQDSEAASSPSSMPLGSPVAEAAAAITAATVLTHHATEAVDSMLFDQPMSSADTSGADGATWPRRTLRARRPPITIGPQSPTAQPYDHINGGGGGGGGTGTGSSSGSSSAAASMLSKLMLSPSPHEAVPLSPSVPTSTTTTAGIGMAACGPDRTDCVTEFIRQRENNAASTLAPTLAPMPLDAAAASSSSTSTSTSSSSPTSNPNLSSSSASIPVLVNDTRSYFWMQHVKVSRFDDYYRMNDTVHNRTFSIPIPAQPQPQQQYQQQHHHHQTTRA